MLRNSINGSLNARVRFRGYANFEDRPEEATRISMAAVPKDTFQGIWMQAGRVDAAPDDVEPLAGSLVARRSMSISGRVSRPLWQIVREAYLPTRGGGASALLDFYEGGDNSPVSLSPRRWRQQLASAAAVPHLTLDAIARWRGVSADGWMRMLSEAKGAAEADEPSDHPRAASNKSARGTSHHLAPRLSTAFELDSRRLSTFDAYMTACETMWGVIIFLKFGLLVSRGGVVLCLLVLCTCAGVQLLNCLAVSAVASNGLHDGTYSLLVANLGPIWGATASLLYYLGMSALATVEICGAVEALDVLLQQQVGPQYMTGSAYLDTGAIGTASLVLLANLRGYNSGAVHTIGQVVLLAFFGTLVATVSGALLHGSWRNLIGNLSPLQGWAHVSYEDVSLLFTFIYPCFAGIFQPVNKAGLLRTPFSSVPRASIGAVLTSAAVFAMILLSIGSTAPLDRIDEEDFLLYTWPNKYVGLVGTIVVGVGSCVSCLDVAPTILQTVAADNIVPGLQALGVHRLSGTNSEPQAATAFTLALAIPFAWLGGIEAVALAAAALFLQMYFTMDVCCLLLAACHSPGWRPKWPQIKPWQAGLAAAMCMLTMLLLKPLLAPWVLLAVSSGAMAISFLSGDVELGGGEAISGLLYSVALTSLHALQEDLHLAEGMGAELAPLRWRPQLLCLVPSPHHTDSSPDAEDEADLNASVLALLAHRLKEGRGLTVLATVVDPQLGFTRTEDGDVVVDIASIVQHRSLYARAKHRLTRLAEAAALSCFVDATVSAQYAAAVGVVINCVGVGALRPNTVLIGWPLPEGDELDGAECSRHACEAMEALERALAYEKAVLLLAHPRVLPELIFPQTEGGGVLDIWWVSHDGALPLMIGHLLTRHELMRRYKVRTFMWLEQHEALDLDVAERRLRTFLHHLRLNTTHVELLAQAAPLVGKTAKERALEKERQLNQAMAARALPETMLVITNLTAPCAEHMEAPSTYTELLVAACLHLPPVLFVCGGAAEQVYVS